jgi:hypothetical protein
MPPSGDVYFLSVTRGIIRRKCLDDLNLSPVVLFNRIPRNLLADRWYPRRMPIFGTSSLSLACETKQRVKRVKLPSNLHHDKQKGRESHT